MKNSKIKSMLASSVANSLKNAEKKYENYQSLSKAAESQLKNVWDIGDVDPEDLFLLLSDVKSKNRGHSFYLIQISK